MPELTSKYKSNIKMAKVPNIKMAKVDEELRVRVLKDKDEKTVWQRRFFFLCRCYNERKNFSATTPNQRVPKKKREANNLS